MKTQMFLFLFAYALLGGMANAQNVSIQLTPQGVPIQIPAPGGSFNYIIAATNNGTTPQQASVWCMVTLPNGSSYGPVLGPVTISLNPGQTMDRLRTQGVPAEAPTGDYIFNAYIGVYPNVVWDSDSFPFEKTLEGSELWVAQYNGSSNDWDEGWSIAVDAGGFVYVTGNCDPLVSPLDYLTIKYDASGNQIWISSYNGPGNASDWANSVAVDAAGNVYVTGGSNGAGTSSDFATIKYDPNGNQLWVARYNGPANGFDDAQTVAVDAGGNAYVTGRSTGSGTGYDYATVKYDASGNQLWVARYNGPGNDTDQPYSLAVDGSGNAYVTGRSEGSGTSYDYATIKYNAVGEPQWVSRYNGPGNYSDAAYSLALDGNSNVYVTGAVGYASYASDYATIKYDSSGNQIWMALYNGGFTDEATCLALDAESNVYVTGASGVPPNSADYATLKYNANGNQLWVARYNGPGGGDWPTSLAVDGSGNIHVTGRSGIGGYFDYATIKYDGSGNQLWVASYNGTANSYDGANSIAVDGSGNVYVTGGVNNSGTGMDCVTIKYSGGNLDNWMPVESTILGQPLPQECRLEQNYPNPFNATTVLSYQLPAASLVRLSIYDPMGRLVETLVDGWRPAGQHELTFDASSLPSGMYFAKLAAGDYNQVQKLVLLK